MRDMTQAQLFDAFKKHEFKYVGFLGYVEVPVPNGRVGISRFNAGTNHRAQLAYVLKEQERAIERVTKEQDERAAKKAAKFTEEHAPLLAENERLRALLAVSARHIAFRSDFTTDPAAKFLHDEIGAALAAKVTP